LAHDILDELRYEIGWLTKKQRWLIQDNAALNYISILEDEATGFCVEPELPRTQREALQREIGTQLAIFNEALPFDEGERRWLTPTWLDIPGSWRERHKALCNAEGEIVVNGVHRTVQGADLMRRWRSWRREFDEYEGQGTLDIARTALARLVELTPAARRWPEHASAMSPLCVLPKPAGCA
jgi:hypothetical protein